MFGQLNDVKITPFLSIVQFNDLAYSVAEHAREYDSDIPWLPPMHDGYDGNNLYTHTHIPYTNNPKALMLLMSQITLYLPSQCKVRHVLV